MIRRLRISEANTTVDIIVMFKTGKIVYQIVFGGEKMSTDRYTSPLSERYASKEMQYIFSQDMKFRTWRRLWIALAEIEKELGLNITQEQIDELKAHQDDINYDVARAREKESSILEQRVVTLVTIQILSL